jgi:2-dehydro-3-deoxyphosphogluconate aldolase/(4S)-4-hydroxy-2-oxoglutarate aldolase
MPSNAWAVSWAFGSVPDRAGSARLSLLLGRQVVLPLVEAEDATQAVRAARALVDHGLPAIELALRTEGAMEAVDAVRAAIPSAVVGVGTVLSSDQLVTAVAAGAAFAISPGSSDELLAAARDCSIPFVPGVATATELMRVIAAGISEAKFFPAQASGGVSALAALAAIAPSVRFLPTGGIDAASAPDYLRHSHVFAVGGSWVCPRDLVRRGASAEIGELARAASLLPGYARS